MERAEGTSLCSVMACVCEPMCVFVHRFIVNFYSTDCGISYTTTNITACWPACLSCPHWPLTSAMPPKSQRIKLTNKSKYNMPHTKRTVKDECMLQNRLWSQHKDNNNNWMLQMFPTICSLLISIWIGCCGSVSVFVLCILGCWHVESKGNMP